MKKSICLYFQVHQPSRLRLYRFFDIGKDSHYYDDFTNRTILKRIVEKCYLPMNELLLNAIEQTKGKFKFAFSISGSALEQFDRYAPEVVESFHELAKTGSVEFLCETYNHSLASLISKEEFKRQVQKHKAAIEEHFGVVPKVFRNTELIYSDAIAANVLSLGFKTMLTEGARHIMAWRSPNYVYCATHNLRMRLLLRNYSLSDDIAFRFSSRGWDQWPLTVDKYLHWLRSSDGEIINLFMDYETFGEHQSEDSGIFEFMKFLPTAVVKDANLEFVTPSRAVSKHKPIDEISVPEPISWADEERDMSAWLGNELQQDAFNKLYSVSEKVSSLNNVDLSADFGHLQESDHLYYMCTKFFTDGEVHSRMNPYSTPYEAFINYMNVLSDFMARVETALEENK